MEDLLRDTEERFRRYFDLGLIGMATTSPTKGILEVNDELCRILGYTRDELLQKTWAEMTHPDDLVADVAQFNRVMKGEMDGYTLDKRWVRKDGEIIHGAISVKAVRHADGSVDYFVALLQDVTERHRMDEALRRAHDEMEQRVVFRTSQLLAINDELIREIDKREKAQSEAVELRAELEDELDMMTRLHELSTRLLSTSDLQPLLEEVLDATIALLGADFGHVQLYDASTRALKIVAQRGFQKDFLDHFDNYEGTARCGPTTHSTKRIIVEDMQNEPVSALHLKIVQAAGYRAVQCTPLSSHRGERLGMISTHFRKPHRPSERELRMTDLYARQAAELIERKRGEEMLRRSESHLAEAQRIGHVGSWIWNVATGECFWSREHFRIFGLDPDTFKPTKENTQRFIHPDDLQLVEQTLQTAIRDRRQFEVSYRIIRPDGSIRYHRGLGHPVEENHGDLEFIGMVVDVTERIQAEEALRRAHAELAHVSRVTTLGALTASIAHEVNQPLGAIVTNGEACLRLLSRPDPELDATREAVESMITDGIRASEVIQRVRALLRKSTFARSSHNLNNAIRDVLALTARELEKNKISLALELAPDLPLIVADRVQLQQVVLNLILNGIESMSRPGWHSRDLLIKTEQPAASRLQAMFRDTGVGIDLETRERIFEPFFTSKEGGLGLGLSISRTIIESHGGRLWTTPNANTPGSSFYFTVSVN